MCELLGLAFNNPINPSLSFRGFRRRGNKNPHGWGIAFYPDNSCQIIKEPLNADNSELSEFIMGYAKNRRVLSNLIYLFPMYVGEVLGKIHIKIRIPFSESLTEKR